MTEHLENGQNFLLDGNLDAARAAFITALEEEPENMGARTYLHPLFTRVFQGRPPVRWESREASASPATGSPKAHRIEQEDLLERTFRTLDPPAPKEA